MPSLIDAVREESCPWEKVGLIFAKTLRPPISLRYRAVKTERVILTLLDGFLSDQTAECIIESEQLRIKKLALKGSIDCLTVP